ncbi:MAG: molybdate ABC transporter permease subunit [Treponema sp.]|jgi:molybdate transport system permease protein|nr:molybdate ABC transporter permease subunit [Treponema sp.]
MDLTPLYISLRASVYATVFAFICGTLAAWAVIHIQGKLRAVADGVFTLPLVLPPTVLGFFLLCIFGTRSLVGQVLLKAGIRIVFDWKGTVAASSVVAFPLVYRTVRAAFEQIDESILNAAQTLGISGWKIFTRILIPSARPGITAGTILAFTRALGEFGATLMLAGDIPGKTETIPIAIWSAAYGGDMNRALVWVIIIVAISFATITAMNLFGQGAKRK